MRRDVTGGELRERIQKPFPRVGRVEFGEWDEEEEVRWRRGVTDDWRMGTWGKMGVVRVRVAFAVPPLWIEIGK